MDGRHTADGDERRRRVASAARRMGLADRVPGARVTELLDLGLQDSPPGAAITALAARCDGRLELGGTAIVWTVRGAPHLIRAADLGWWQAALRPVDVDDLAARLYSYGARLVREGHDPLAGLDLTAAAMRQVLSGSELSRAQLSAEVTKLVDDPYRPYCTGCRVVHVQENLFRFGALQAGVEVRHESRITTFRLSDAAARMPSPATARRQLVRRFAGVAEPARPQLLAAWLGTDNAAAERIWAAADRDGAVRRGSDLDAVAVQGVRLVPSTDPFLRLVDRDLLTPHVGHRNELFKALGTPGALLVAGDVVGTWRAKSTTKSLVVSVHSWSPLAAEDRDALEAEAGRLAQLRNVSTAGVDVS
jgi:hypothetical protein